MKFAVRTNKLNSVKHQLLSTLGLASECLTVSATKYNGITLLDISEKMISTLNSASNIEMFLIDEVEAAELANPTSVESKCSFKSLDRVHELEQYDHFIQLIHIQKAMIDKT